MLGAYSLSLSWLKWALVFKKLHGHFLLQFLFLGLSAGFLGTFVEKNGPRISGLTATAFFGIGMFGTALALHLQSLILLYICYGVIGGIGLGIGYITPVSTLVNIFLKDVDLLQVLLSWDLVCKFNAGPIMTNSR